jgi:outer membrane protein assembly factor BamE
VSLLPRAALLFALLVAGCGNVPLITPYKLDVQQGNVVTQEMVARLKPGMTRSQVRFTLGTPLLVDPFRADRWDYVFVFMKQGVVTEQRRIVVIFKDDKLLRVEGDVVAAGVGAARTDKLAPPADGAAPARKPDG